MSANCARRRYTNKELLVNWLIIPLIGGFLIAFIMDTEDFLQGKWKFVLQSGLLSSTYWSVLANGNDWIVHLLDKRWTWLEAPLKRTLIGILFMFVYTVLASLIIIALYVTFALQLNFWELLWQGRLWNSLLTPLFITVVFALWGHGRAFLMEWRQAAIDVERLKTENLKSKFESLKTQVNPHFLFNSLNALTNLVYADQDKAADFIQKLAEVYRYVIDHQNDELVPLAEEMAFLKSYVFLNEIRFGKNLNVQFTGWEGTSSELMVPPVSLQMLVENAIKHNEVSSDYPLHIEVKIVNDNILIINNLNKLNKPKSDSLGVGLENIKARFKMLTNKPVEVRQDGQVFQVSVPLLTIAS